MASDLSSLFWNFDFEFCLKWAMILIKITGHRVSVPVSHLRQSDQLTNELFKADLQVLWRHTTTLLWVYFTSKLATWKVYDMIMTDISPSWRVLTKCPRVYSMCNCLNAECNFNSLMTLNISRYQLGHLAASDTCYTSLICGCRHLMQKIRTVFLKMCQINVFWTAAHCCESGVHFDVIPSKLLQF